MRKATPLKMSVHIYYSNSPVTRHFQDLLAVILLTNTTPLFKIPSLKKKDEKQMDKRTDRYVNYVMLKCRLLFSKLKNTRTEKPLYDFGI